MKISEGYREQEPGTDFVLKFYPEKYGHFIRLSRDNYITARSVHNAH